MKIPPPYASRPRERGMAVIVVLALVAIVLIYVAGNLRALHNLGGELKLVERRQIHRLQNTAQEGKALVVTNAVPENQPAQK